MSTARSEGDMAAALALLAEPPVCTPNLRNVLQQRTAPAPTDPTTSSPPLSRPPDENANNSIAMGQPVPPPQLQPEQGPAPSLQPLQAQNPPTASLQPQVQSNQPLPPQPLQTLPHRQLEQQGLVEPTPQLQVSQPLPQTLPQSLSEPERQQQSEPIQQQIDQQQQQVTPLSQQVTLPSQEVQAPPQLQEPRVQAVAATTLINIGPDGKAEPMPCDFCNELAQPLFLCALCEGRLCGTCDRREHLPAFRRCHVRVVEQYLRSDVDVERRAEFVFRALDKRDVGSVDAAQCMALLRHDPVSQAAVRHELIPNAEGRITFAEWFFLFSRLQQQNIVHCTLALMEDTVLVQHNRIQALFRALSPGQYDGISEATSDMDGLLRPSPSQQLLLPRSPVMPSRDSLQHASDSTTGFGLAAVSTGHGTVAMPVALAPVQIPITQPAKAIMESPSPNDVVLWTGSCTDASILTSRSGEKPGSSMYQLTHQYRAFPVNSFYKLFESDPHTFNRMLESSLRHDLGLVSRASWMDWMSKLEYSQELCAVLDTVEAALLSLSDRVDTVFSSLDFDKDALVPFNDVVDMFLACAEDTRPHQLPIDDPATKQATQDPTHTTPQDTSSPLISSEPGDALRSACSLLPVGSEASLSTRSATSLAPTEAGDSDSVSGALSSPAVSTSPSAASLALAHSDDRWTTTTTTTGGATNLLAVPLSASSSIYQLSDPTSSVAVFQRLAGEPASPCGAASPSPPSSNFASPLPNSVHLSASPTPLSASVALLPDAGALPQQAEREQNPQSRPADATTRSADSERAKERENESDTEKEREMHQEVHELSSYDADLIAELRRCVAGKHITLQELHEYFFTLFQHGRLNAALGRWETALRQWCAAAQRPVPVVPHHYYLSKRNRLQLLREIELRGGLVRLPVKPPKEEAPAVGYLRSSGTTFLPVSRPVEKKAELPDEQATLLRHVVVKTVRLNHPAYVSPAGTAMGAIITSFADAVYLKMHRDALASETIEEYMRQRRQVQIELERSESSKIRKPGTSWQSDPSDSLNSDYDEETRFISAATTRPGTAVSKSRTDVDFTLPSIVSPQAQENMSSNKIARLALAHQYHLNKHSDTKRRRRADRADRMAQARSATQFTAGKPETAPAAAPTSSLSAAPQTPAANEAKPSSVLSAAAAHTPTPSSSSLPTSKPGTAHTHSAAPVPASSPPLVASAEGDAIRARRTSLSHISTASTATAGTGNKTLPGAAGASVSSGANSHMASTSTLASVMSSGTRRAHRPRSAVTFADRLHAAASTDDSDTADHHASSSRGAAQHTVGRKQPRPSSALRSSTSPASSSVSSSAAAATTTTSVKRPESAGGLKAKLLEEQMGQNADAFDARSTRSFDADNDLFGGYTHMLL